MNARRSDNAPFEVPIDNTTRQAMALDEEEKQLENEEQTEDMVSEITVCMNGKWIPLQVDVVSLRRAVGLPDHRIFTRGIFHEFRPPEASNPTLEDEDHQTEQLANGEECV